MRPHIGKRVFFTDCEAPGSFPQLAPDGIEQPGRAGASARQNKLRMAMADWQRAAEVLKLPSLQSERSFQPVKVDVDRFGTALFSSHAETYKAARCRNR